MHHTNEYKERLKTFSLLIETGVNVSNEIRGREAKNEGELHAADIFIKIIQHGISIQRLLPGTKLYKEEAPYNLYDISSISSLTRAIIDAYLIMFYISIDKISGVEEKFRLLLWEYHGINRQLKKLELIFSKDKKIKNIKSRKDVLLDQIKNNTFYLKLPSDKQKDIRQGKKGIFLTNTEICKKAAIQENYYKVIYMYLSSFIHTYPFSISQISSLARNNEDVEMLLKTILDYAIGFYCRALEDFTSLHPDVKNKLTPVKEIIKDWKNLHREFRGVEYK